MQRIAVAYSDGSFTVQPDGWPMERIVAECDGANRGEREAHWAQIVNVNIEVLDKVVVPLTAVEKADRNKRVQSRYDELMREGKHGHYETMFRVVREEVERANSPKPD